MMKPTQIQLAPNAISALHSLSSAVGTPPEQLVDDALACLVASNGMKDFIYGTQAQRSLARRKSGVVTWKTLDNAARVIEEMQAKIDAASAVLRRAKIAKGRYTAHNDLWSELLLGLSVQNDA